MSRPSKRSIAMRKLWERRRNAARAERVAVPPTRELDDMRVIAERATELLHDGMAKINEAHDLFNSIPKRVK